MAEQNLLPCPFCGLEDSVEVSASPGYCFARCKNCEAEGPFARTKEEAIELWNRRVPF